MARIPSAPAELHIPIRTKGASAACAARAAGETPARARSMRLDDCCAIGAQGLPATTRRKRAPEAVAYRWLIDARLRCSGSSSRR